MQNNLPEPPVIGGDPPVSNPSPVTSSSAPSNLNQVTTPSTSSFNKEREILSNNTSEMPKIEEILTDVELAPELTDVGVTEIKENVVVPPDLKQLGVQPIGPTQPVIQTNTVTLPLSNEQILVGLHAHILSGIRWLAEWCTRQLKRAHTHIVKVGDKAYQQKD